MIRARLKQPETIIGASLLLALAALFARIDLLIPEIVCLFHMLTDLPCLTCGGTRALYALIEGDLLRAIEMNPLVALGALGAMAFVAYSAALLVFGMRPIRPDFRRGTPLLLLRYGTPAALALNWSYLIVAGR
jgi:hypothetical protein